MTFLSFFSNDKFIFKCMKLLRNCGQTNQMVSDFELIKPSKVQQFCVWITRETNRKRKEHLGKDISFTFPQESRNCYKIFKGSKCYHQIGNWCLFFKELPPLFNCHYCSNFISKFLHEYSRVKTIYWLRIVAKSLKICCHPISQEL